MARRVGVRRSTVAAMCSLRRVTPDLFSHETGVGFAAQVSGTHRSRAAGNYSGRSDAFVAPPDRSLGVPGPGVLATSE